MSPARDMAYAFAGMPRFLEAEKLYTAVITSEDWAGAYRRDVEAVDASRFDASVVRRRRCRRGVGRGRSRAVLWPRSRGRLARYL